MKEEILLSSFDKLDLDKQVNEYIEKGYSPGIVSIYFDKKLLRKKFSRWVIKEVTSALPNQDHPN